MRRWRPSAGPAAGDLVRISSSAPLPFVRRVTAAGGAEAVAGYLGVLVAVSRGQTDGRSGFVLWSTRSFAWFPLWWLEPVGRTLSQRRARQSIKRLRQSAARTG